MNKTALLAVFAAASFLTLIGAMFKIQHWPYATPFLATGLIAQLVFLVIALSELIKMKGLRQGQKVMWIIGLLFIAPLSYLLFVIWYCNQRNRNAYRSRRLFPS